MGQRGAFLACAVFTWIIGWVLPLHAQTVDVDAAKKEGKVVVYAAVPPQTMKVINEPFEKKNSAYGSTTGALQRPEYSSGRSTSGGSENRVSMSSKATKDLS